MLSLDQARRVAGVVLQRVDEAPSGDRGGGGGHAEAGRALPERIGDCRLIRLIASGGMGAVFEAVQDHPRRTVALKLLRPGLTSGSRAALRRLQYEAEVLGRLQHPGIAQIFAAGSYDAGAGGVPYFVMEYVPAALPITEFAERHSLHLHQRLELIAQVCDAVHTAHLKGFIHRDLKPANILVPSPPLPEGEGRVSAGDSPWRGEGPLQPKIIDFGIARATDADITLTTMHTDVGQLVGTIQYMSPEQFEPDSSDLDVRSDVYSLGVVLFELLTNRLPYKLSSSSPGAAARVVQQQPPQQPSLILRTLRGDIETIVLKALEKDRARRYQSAADLAADVRRFLAGESIEARPPTGWSRTIRWIGKHPKFTTAFACSAAVFLTFGAGWIATAYVNVQPAHFRLAEDRSEAWLMSWSGRDLEHLGGAGPNNVGIAAIADRPKQLGGGKVALIDVSAGECSTDGQLWICHPGDLSRPIWSTEPDPDFIAYPAPPLEWGLVDWPTMGFEVRMAHVVDVFPESESPGEEIVAIHVQDNSPCAVRVYDFSRKVLFEAWHRGLIQSVYWHPGARVLVCAGDRHGPEGNPESYGAKSDDRWAKVVFAIRPKLKQRVGWIHDSSNPDAVRALAWYRWMLPPQAWDRFSGLRVYESTVNSDQSSSVEVGAMSRDASGATISWQMNTHDGSVLGAPSLNDPYNRAMRDNRVPDPKLLSFGDMPQPRIADSLAPLSTAPPATQLPR